jgi:hypothetical protein
MELSVRAFNEAYEMANLVTGILHFLSSSGWKGLLFLVMCLTLLVALIGAARRVQIPMVLLLAFFFPLALYTALITATVKLNVSDEYTLESYTLSNVPFGLALPLSVSSQLEMGLTELIDDNVRPATSPSFFTVDFMGSARMMSAVTNSNLYNVPHIIKTIGEYGKYCVIPALASGDITYEQIQREPDLAAYLNFGYQVYFSPIYSPGGTSAIRTCDAAYQWIINEIGTYSNIGYGSDFAKQVTAYMGRRGDNVILAAATLNAGVSSLFSGFQDSSEQLFQQLFLLNGLKRTLSTINPSLGLSMAEVEMKQISAQTVAGILNIKHLSRYRTFLKLFLIAIMPIVASFWFFNTGRAFGLWCGIFLWVSLFLPLEAAIHAVYTATTLAEMRNFTDPFGGYTMLTEGAVLRWATETNAMAANLMLGIFAFSALILKMSIPVAGQAVMSMITASQNQTRFQSQAASNVLEATERRAVGMASDRTAELMAGKGQYKAALNRADDLQFGAFEGKKGAGGNLWNNDPIWQRTNEQAISRSLGGNANLTASVTDSMSQAADSAVTNSLTTMKSTASGYRASNSTSQNESDIQSFKSLIGKNFSAGVQDQFSSGYAQTQQMVETHGRQSGWSEDQIKSAQAQAGASFGASFLVGLNTKGGTSAGKDSKTSDSASQGLSVGDNESVSKMAQASAQNAIGKSGSLAREDSYSTGTASQQTRDNYFQRLNQSASSVSKAMSSRAAINSVSSAGGSVGLDVDRVVGKEYDTSKFRNLRAESPRLDALFNNNPHATVQDMQVALAQDIRDAITRGPGALKQLANGMREQGFQNMDTFADIVNAGGHVQASFGGHDYELPGGMQVKGGTTMFTPKPADQAAPAAGATRPAGGGRSRDAGSTGSTSAAAKGSGTAPVPAASDRGGSTQAAAGDADQASRGKSGSSGGRKASRATVTVTVGRADGSKSAASASSSGDSSSRGIAPAAGGNEVPGKPQSGDVMPPAPSRFGAQPSAGPSESSGARAAYEQFGPGSPNSTATADPESYVGRVGKSDVKAPEGTDDANTRREGEKGDMKGKSSEMQQRHNDQNPATSELLDSIWDPGTELEKSLNTNHSEMLNRQLGYNPLTGQIWNAQTESWEKPKK